MDAARVMIALNSESLACKVRAILAEAGCMVVGQSGDGAECLRKLRLLKPDLAVMEQNLVMMSGYDVARVVLEDRICSVILLASLEQESIFSPLKEDANFTCLVKPVSKSVLINTLELMIRNSRKIRALEKEIEELKASLDTRKEVEKAKGLLMKHLGLSESDAFKRIQKQSMDRGIAMREIAKAIILAYDI